MNTPLRVALLSAVLVAYSGSIVPEGTAGPMDLKSSAAAKFPKRALFLFRGMVQDTEASPVAGARLTVIPSGGNERPWEAATDSDGRFLVVSERVEEAAFFIAVEGYKPFRTRSRPANGSRIEIIVSKLFRLSGRVIDAESRAAIDGFRIIPGESFGAKRPVAWYRNSEQPGKAGNYSFVADRKGGLISVAIEADQYLPVVSPPFKAPGWHTFDFELKRGFGLAGKVAVPNGAAAAEAHLVLAAAFQNVALDESGRLQSDQPGFTVSDSEGRFRLAARFEPKSIFATHENGFVRMPVEDFLDGGTVRLEPWGGVRGMVRGGLSPGLRRSVALRSTAPESQSLPGESPRISLLYATRPGADGGFVFDQVPPGEYKLRLFQELVRGGEPLLTRQSLVSVGPGEISSADIGGDGRQIKGRVSVFGEDPGAFDWLQAESAFKAKPMGLNPGTEGRLEFPVLIQRSGLFELADVPPGVYELTISLRSPPDEQRRVMVLGTLNREVAVPEEAGQNPGEPMDIGPLRLEVQKRGNTAPLAPVF